LLTRNKFLSSKNNPKISNEAQTIAITLNFYFVQSDNVGSRIRRLLAKAVVVPDTRTKYQSMLLIFFFFVCFFVVVDFFKLEEGETRTKSHSLVGL